MIIPLFFGAFLVPEGDTKKNVIAIRLNDFKLAIHKTHKEERHLEN